MGPIRSKATVVALRLLTPVLAVGLGIVPLWLALEAGAVWAKAEESVSQDNAAAQREELIWERKKMLGEAAIRSMPAVVRILGTGSPGSGVIVKQQGNTYVVLTAGHVVKGATVNDVTTVVTNDGLEHPATKIEISTWLDLAAVYFKSSISYPKVAIGDAGDSKEENGFVVVLGYPMNSDKAIFVPGYIAHRSLNPSDRPGGYTIGYFTRVPAPSEWNWKQDTVKGMSGGPVLDASGRLVAIHGEADQLPVLRVSDNAQAVNSGISLGIPAQIWERFHGDLSSLTEDQYRATATPEDESVDSLVLKATKAESEGRPADAINYYSQALSRDPNNGSLYGNRARVKEGLGDLKGALLDFNRAVDLFPSSWQVFALRGSLRSELGDHQGAQNDFNRSLRLRPDYYRAEAWKMRDFIRSGRGADAVRVGETSMAGVSPDSQQALVVGSELVRAYANQGKEAEALALARRLFEAQPGQSLLALQVSQVYINLLDQPDEGLRFLRKSFPRFAGNPGFVYQLSIAELDYGNPKVAVRLLERLARSNPEDASLHRYLCYALQKDRKPNEAIPSCMASLHLEPKSPYTHRYLGLAFSDLNRHREAVDQSSKSLEYAEQKSAIDFLNRAESQWKLGNRTAACDDYKKALGPELAETQTPNEIRAKWVPDFFTTCSAP